MDFVTGIVVTLRGRVQVQWRVVRNGAVYTVRNCHILLDNKVVICGKGNKHYQDIYANEWGDLRA